MSAMSASPVKPVLPPAGVVPPPVATSPPKVSMMQIPPTLTIAPSKPANMNHNSPMSLIKTADMHAQQYTPPNQPGIPPSMPISQPLPRTPEKPKDLSAPIAMSMKPTSNGMEPQNQPNPPSLAVPAAADLQVSAVPPPPPKIEAPAVPEVQENNTPSKPTPAENLAEPPPAPAAPPVEPDIEKKVEPAPPKPTEPVSKSIAAPPPPQPVPAPAPAPVTQPLEATPAIPAPTPAPAVPTPAPAAPTAASAPPTTATAPPATQAPTQAPPPPVEQPVAPSVSRTETNVPHSKPEMKVATIPRQATKRKREPKVVPEPPEIKKEGKDEDRKSKRVRLPTQPYQSPLPELNIIAKINKSSKATPTKAADDKLIVFYKNEFLAVRNAEGGFYVCQAMQNIYKSSPRIRIRWLSQEEGKDTYSPDFYDHTDFDCILTNLNLDKIDKEKFRLPTEEQQRTESILKRALDVEKGVSEKPPVTEEHPDGLDLSLFRDESQLKKAKNKSGKRSVKSDGEESTSNEEEDEDEAEEEEEEDEDEEKETKKKTSPKTSKRKKKSAKKKAPPPSEKKTAAKSATVNNKSTVQPAKKKTETRVGNKRKSSVSSNTQPLEKKTRKSDTSSQPSDRTNKTRSAGAGAEAVAGVKSRRDRRAKSRK